MRDYHARCIAWLAVFATNLDYMILSPWAADKIGAGFMLIMAGWLSVYNLVLSVKRRGK